MKIAYWITDVEKLRPLAELWLAESHNDFGLDIDIDRILKDMDAWTKLDHTELIVCMDDDKPVGFLAVFMSESFLGRGLIAVEKYWYVKPDSRMCGPMLIKEAKNWAMEKGCFHLIMSASNLASDKYNKVCNFYEKMGMKLFETSYITKVNDGSV